MTDEAVGRGRTPGYDPRCKPCSHPCHDEYDKAYFNGEISKSEYARKVGCSINSVRRHIEGHVPKNLSVATDAKAVTRADDLLGQICYYEAEARRYKDEAEAKGDIDLALKAVDRALRCIEIYAKVRGIIQDTQININQVSIFSSSEWLVVGEILARILAPYPELRAEVAREMLDLQEAHR
jgi:hypothetical protein